MNKLISVALPAFVKKKCISLINLVIHFWFKTTLEHLYGLRSCLRVKFTSRKILIFFLRGLYIIRVNQALMSLKEAP